MVRVHLVCLILLFSLLVPLSAASSLAEQKTNLVGSWLLSDSSSWTFTNTHYIINDDTVATYKLLRPNVVAFHFNAQHLKKSKVETPKEFDTLYFYDIISGAFILPPKPNDYYSNYLIGYKCESGQTVSEAISKLQGKWYSSHYQTAFVGVGNEFDGNTFITHNSSKDRDSTTVKIRYDSTGLVNRLESKKRNYPIFVNDNYYCYGSSLYSRAIDFPKEKMKLSRKKRRQIRKMKKVVHSFRNRDVVLLKKGIQVSETSGDTVGRFEFFTPKVFVLNDTLKMKVVSFSDAYLCLLYPRMNDQIVFLSSTQNSSLEEIKRALKFQWRKVALGKVIPISERVRVFYENETSLYENGREINCDPYKLTVDSMGVVSIHQPGESYFSRSIIEKRIDLIGDTLFIGDDCYLKVAKESELPPVPIGLQYRGTVSDISLHRHLTAAEIDTLFLRFFEVDPDLKNCIYYRGKTLSFNLRHREAHQLFAHPEVEKILKEEGVIISGVNWFRYVTDRSERSYRLGVFHKEPVVSGDKIVSVSVADGGEAAGSGEVRALITVEIDSIVDSTLHGEELGVMIDKSFFYGFRTLDEKNRFTIPFSYFKTKHWTEGWYRFKSFFKISSTPEDEKPSQLFRN